ncbi:DgyrCDS13294 [Dimorphilus gyrociliatus]|uniref:DgyrCDS13294 n=1 Tax=Dimorphilus gyrociliatus TaxID=2664684 RepID=A0A7I8WA79_9ANNE|nr:DgyrCDS13294 [Dimorphilus gyrociliatus]
MDRDEVNPTTENEDDDHPDDNEEMDPRVQAELECMNDTATEINKLENVLEVSRRNFRIQMKESTETMNAMYRKLKSAVNKARPYYEAVREAKKAHSQAQTAAKEYQMAIDRYRAAKETVCIAEKRLKIEMEENPGEDKRILDPAWQEMMNHATIKFMDAENSKTQLEEIHKVKAVEYSGTQQRVRELERKMPLSIGKAKPYFDTKEKLEHILEQQKSEIELNQKEIIEAKQQYSNCLMRLEKISDDIRRKRNIKNILPPRTPGVGAEVDKLSDLASINLDDHPDDASVYSTDLLSDTESICSDTAEYFRHRTNPSLFEFTSSKSEDNTEVERGRDCKRNRDIHSAPTSNIHSPEDEKGRRRPRVAGRSSSRKSLKIERVRDNHPLALGEKIENVESVTVRVRDGEKTITKTYALTEVKDVQDISVKKEKKKLSQGVLLAVGQLSPPNI